jgi:TRAP-type C4-dicarboxylate transport system permease small subunit
MEIDERKAMSGIVATLSAIVMLVGLIGMGICFLFIWSSSQIEVMGAGMGFITGAIMIGSGLIALSNVARGVQKAEDRKAA